jgi:transcriptional regulator with XRE-family HTH domain
VKINGIRYHRLKQRLSMTELADRAGMFSSALGKVERQHNLDNLHGSTLLNLSNALHVPADELVQFYDSSLLKEGDRASYPSQSDNLNNCVAIYRRATGITYADLAKRLGITTKEGGRKACNRDTPSPKHVQALALYEHISPEEFSRRYRSQGGEPYD